MGSGEGLLLGCRLPSFFVSLHGRKRVRELSGVPFIRALISFLRAPPSVPSHSQRLHLLTLSPWM